MLTKLVVAVALSLALPSIGQAQFAFGKREAVAPTVQGPAAFNPESFPVGNRGVLLADYLGLSGVSFLGISGTNRDWLEQQLAQLTPNGQPFFERRIGGAKNGAIVAPFIFGTAGVARIGEREDATATITPASEGFTLMLEPKTQWAAETKTALLAALFKNSGNDPAYGGSDSVRVGEYCAGKVVESGVYVACGTKQLNRGLTAPARQTASSGGSGSESAEAARTIKGFASFASFLDDAPSIKGAKESATERGLFGGTTTREDKGWGSFYTRNIGNGRWAPIAVPQMEGVIPSEMYRPGGDIGDSMAEAGYKEVKTPNGKIWVGDEAESSVFRVGRVYQTEKGNIRSTLLGHIYHPFVQVNAWTAQFSEATGFQQVEANAPLPSPGQCDVAQIEALDYKTPGAGEAWRRTTGAGGYHVHPEVNAGAITKKLADFPDALPATLFLVTQFRGHPGHFVRIRCADRVVAKPVEKAPSVEPAPVQTEQAKSAKTLKAVAKPTKAKK